MEQKLITRLQYLNTMLNKYSHRWSQEPSNRMYNWVDEYHDIKENNRKVWEMYCEQYGFTLDHDAYDCMA